MNTLTFTLIVLIIGFVVYYVKNKQIKNVDGFTPKIREFYRPYIRNIGLNVDNFKNNYNLEVMINKLRKWNIY